MSLYIIIKPNSEKYKRNVFIAGALAWNSLGVVTRKSQTHLSIKDVLNEKVIAEIVPKRR